MREQPVEADGDPQAGDRVHHAEREQVGPAQRDRPELPGRDPEAEHRHDRDQAGDDAVARLVRDRLDVVGRRRLSVLVPCSAARGRWGRDGLAPRGWMRGCLCDATDPTRVGARPFVGLRAAAAEPARRRLRR